jgi:hypothetical protein
VGRLQQQQQQQQQQEEEEEPRKVAGRHRVGRPRVALRQKQPLQPPPLYQVELLSPENSLEGSPEGSPDPSSVPRRKGQGRHRGLERARHHWVERVERVERVGMSREGLH